MLAAHSATECELLCQSSTLCLFPGEFPKSKLKIGPRSAAALPCPEGAGPAGPGDTCGVESDKMLKPELWCWLQRMRTGVTSA